jgi:MraZ protein
VEDSAQVTQLSTVVEPPLGIFEAKCDDKGRLKLPVRFAVFLKHSDVSRVFITTTDLRSARIYPEKVWESNQNFFNEPGDDTELAEDISFIANLYGDFSTLDEHGRVLVPTNLRRKLEFEKQSVWLENYRGHINVHPRKVYEERMARALVGIADKAKVLDRKGFR